MTTFQPDPAHVHEGGAGVLVPVPVHLIPTDDRFSRSMFGLWNRSPKWMAPFAMLLCFGGGVAYTLALNPTVSGAFASPTCIVKLTTGFDCPGCGGTRAFWYLLHGNVPAAARSHIVAVFAAPFLVYMYIAWATNLVSTRFKLPYLKISPKMISIFLAAWGVFTILRDLPWAPFTWFFV
jgi:Protein of unknown function (DUF2752)